ncbi:MAG: hypothetical protein ACOYOQ_16250, partial [Microthrixaceae bacterium]
LSYDGEIGVLITPLPKIDDWSAWIAAAIVGGLLLLWTERAQRADRPAPSQTMLGTLLVFGGIAIWLGRVVGSGLLGESADIVRSITIFFVPLGMLALKVVRSSSIRDRQWRSASWRLAWLTALAAVATYFVWMAGVGETMLMGELAAGTELDRRTPQYLAPETARLSPMLYLAALALVPVAEALRATSTGGQVGWVWHRRSARPSGPQREDELNEQ